jgi:hypothetical protein
MTEAEWMASAYPVAMLRHLTPIRSGCCGAMWHRNAGGTMSLAPQQKACGRCDNATVAMQDAFLVSDRKLWLFACGVELVWGWGQGFPGRAKEVWAVMEAADWGAAAVRELRPSHDGWWLRLPAREAAAESLRVHDLPEDRPRWAALLRCVAGNPFRDIYADVDIPRGGYGTTLEGERVGWAADSTVLRLAQAAYDERGRPCERCRGYGKHYPHILHVGGKPGPAEPCPACSGTGRTDDGTLDPEVLAVLSDALEEAGCDNERLLGHLRSEPDVCPWCDGTGWVPCRAEDDPDGDRMGDLKPCRRCRNTGIIETGPHVRGCWAVDLILGKE